MPSLRVRRGCGVAICAGCDIGVQAAAHAMRPSAIMSRRAFRVFAVVAQAAFLFTAACFLLTLTSSRLLVPPSFWPGPPPSKPSTGAAPFRLPSWPRPSDAPARRAVFHCSGPDSPAYLSKISLQGAMPLAAGGALAGRARRNNQVRVRAPGVAGLAGCGAARGSPRSW